jgi:hypothetical protein
LNWAVSVPGEKRFGINGRPWQIQRITPSEFMGSGRDERRQGKSGRLIEMD